MKKGLIPFTLFAIALILRAVGLDWYPHAFGRDEAYLGYNAFSILVTGRDINSNFLPLFIESFLFTPAGYAYFSIPFIKFFGLSVFSVRFASALFGALTIPLFYYLINSLVKLDGVKFFKKEVNIALIASLFLTISPWHLNLSRTASVSTVVLFFILFGVYFLVNYLKEGKLFFLLASFGMFLVSLSFYIAPFSFLPLLIPAISFFYRKQIRHKIIFSVLFVAFLAPVLITYLSPQLSLRVQSLSIFKAPIVGLILTEDASIDGVQNIAPVVSRFFHNKASVSLYLVTQNYLSHFSFPFLFDDKALPDRYRVPQASLLFPIFLILIVIGFALIINTKGNFKWIVIAWLLIAPIGSSMASDDVPNMQRTLFMLPPLLILASLGFAKIYSKKHLVIGKVILLLILLTLLYQLGFYFHQYYFHLNKYRPWYRQDSYSQLVEKINQHKKSFSKVVITDRESAPTIFLLFYNKFDPSKIQNTIRESSLKDTDRISFDVYEITQEECPLKLVTDEKTLQKKLSGKIGVLYVNSGLCKIEELPQNVRLLDTIKREDRSTAFYLLYVQN